MSSWNTLNTIHNHTQTRSATTITMSVRTYMMKKKQKTICKEMDRNTGKKTLYDTRMDNNGIQKGENIVKTRYERTIRKPERLTYQQTTSMLAQPTCWAL